MINNLNYYNVFYMVAKTGSISRAANQLYISQPAVSKAISNLEESIGIALFVRNSRGVALTEEGTILYDYIERALDNIVKGEESLKKYNELGIGHIRIGVSTSLCKHILLDYLKPFIKDNPNIKVSIDCHSTKNTIRLLKNEEIDIGLICETELPKNITYSHIRSIHDIFVANSDYIDNFPYRETDIVGFINDLMQTFNYQAQKKNITFTFEKELEGADSLKVWIDLNNFDKVLMNVLSNAFKYTHEGGNIEVLLKTGHNDAYRGALKDYFEIDITDNGIGIDKNKIEQIFERFYQIDNDMTQSNFGTGIGLHLSRSLVELHHGIIKAENREDGQGTRFIIRLPLGSNHLKAEELENPEETGSEPTISQLPKDSIYETEEENKTNEYRKPKAKTRYRVLIVEDDEEIRRYIRSELDSDFRIYECTNGREGLETILKEKPDLVISDVMMPEMDGITLCRKIKQNININHIPIILLTAKSKAEDQIEGLEIGADAYIVKPFNTELLRTTISNLIANRERLRGKLVGEQQVEEKITKIEMKSNDEILMSKVMKTINDHLADPTLNVEMLAANVGMSRVHMHRKLKELTNQSARDFIRSIRLKQAANLLREKNLSVSEVAYATGFSNLSHFSNTFRDFYGISPSEYKEQQM